MNVRTNRRRRLAVGIKALVLVVVVVLAALIPMAHVSIGGALPGAVNSPGTLQLLSQMLVIGALAVSLYVLVGMTGLMSLGHGMYFAIGAYGTVILTNDTPLPFWSAALLAMVISTAVAFLANAIALRSTGIAFSMITLAFAELINTGVSRGFLDSGSDQGVTLAFEKSPTWLRGLVHTSNVYWLCLGFAIVVIAVVWFSEKRMRIGRVWVAIRENEIRTESIGFDVYGHKIVAATFGSFLASACGVVYAIVTSGANPSITTVMYSLGIILMVILGGRGVVWGAFLGGIIYTYLTLRFPAFAATDPIASLPSWARIVLAQPEFLLGVCFVVIILVLPNGLADGLSRLWRGIVRLVSRRSAGQQAVQSKRME